MYISHLRLNKIAVLAAEELLEKNGIANIKVVSDSMEPFIKTGEYLTFRSKAVCKKPKFGDIILCKQKYKGSLLVHRFYFCRKKNGEYTYFTKADKGWVFDYPSSEEQYMGIYIKKNEKKLLNKIIIFRSIILLPLFIIMTKIRLKGWRLSKIESKY